MESILQQLIDFVKEASPVIWQAYVQQAVISGINSLIFSTMLLVGGILSLLYGKVNEKLHATEEEVTDHWGNKNKPRQDEFRDKYFGAYIVSAICYIWSTIELTMGIGHLFNPNYYAIQLMIDQFK